jgi:hypothetical protein
LGIGPGSILVAHQLEGEDRARERHPEQLRAAAAGRDWQRLSGDKVDYRWSFGTDEAPLHLQTVEDEGQPGCDQGSILWSRIRFQLNK